MAEGGKKQSRVAINGRGWRPPARGPLTHRLAEPGLELVDEPWLAVQNSH
jgi:hypothetical protein